eukprot:5078244-Ditylum_brightwellii.AAC.1
MISVPTESVGIAGESDSRLHRCATEAVITSFRIGAERNKVRLACSYVSAAILAQIEDSCVH